MKYTWDVTVAQYRDAKGHFVPRRSVRKSLDRVILGTGNEMKGLAAEYRKGNLSLSEFALGMRERVKSVHLNSAAAARGGYAQLTQSDYGRVGRILKDQYTYLDRFVGDLDAKLVKLDGQGFFARVQQYFNTARVTYYQFADIAAEEAGFTEERNMLHPAEHCEDCIEMAALGWVPRGTLIPLGDRECGWNDKCDILYR